MKIGIVRFSSLGDVIIASSLLETIKREIPGAEVYFVTKKIYRGLYEHDSRISNLVLLPDTSLYGISRVLKTLDLKIDIHKSLRTYLLRVLDPRGWRTYNSMRWERRAFVRGKRKIPIPPLYLRYNETVKDLVKRADYPPSLEAKNSGEEILKRRRLPLSPVIIAPFASRKSKEWKPVYYAEVAKEITKENPVFIVGAASEWKRGEEIRKDAGKGCYNLAGAFYLSELKEIFRASRCVIGGDTGLLHMADALDVQAIMLFTSTHPALGFAPTRKTTRVLSSGIECQPCHVHGLNRCPRGSFECLDKITPSSVLSVYRGF